MEINNWTYEFRKTFHTFRIRTKWCKVLIKLSSEDQKLSEMDQETIGNFVDPCILNKKDDYNMI